LSLNDAHSYLIHTRALRGLDTFLKANGLSFEELTKQVGLFPADPEHLSKYISMDRFGRLLHLVNKACKDEYAVLKFANSYDIASGGALFHAVMTAPSLRHAIEASLAYKRLYADVPHADLIIGSTYSKLAWAYSPLLLQRDEMSERSMLLILRCFKAVIGENWKPLSVELDRKKPRDSYLYNQWFAPKVIFDAPMNVIEFKTEDLLLKSIRADTHLHELACALCDRMLQERRVPDTLLIQVKEDVIRSLEKDGPLIEHTARRLGMSVRVLQRRLSDEGISYNGITEEIRRELAHEFLRETTLSLSEIAFRLGFSSQGNFTRAVKRWFDCTPKTYRQNSDP
jgi:AraC-like DNA-binding protein